MWPQRCHWAALQGAPSEDPRRATAPPRERLWRGLQTIRREYFRLWSGTRIKKCVLLKINALDNRLWDDADCFGRCELDRSFLPFSNGFEIPKFSAGTLLLNVLFGSAKRRSQLISAGGRFALSWS